MRPVMPQLPQLACPVFLATVLVASAGATGPDVPPGAPRFSIRTWENDEGLPQNSVIAMVQSQDGALWLGTLNGLARFDGERFTVFDESNTPGLPGNPIVCLYEDRRGDLWIGTETAGAWVARAGRLVPLDLGRGSRDGRLVAVTEDAAGAVWLYTADGQLARARGEQLEVWKVNVSAPGAWGLARETNGLLCLGTGRGVLAFTPNPPPAAAPLSLAFETVTGRVDRVIPSARGGHWRLTNGAVEYWRGAQRERSLGPYPWGAVPVGAAIEDPAGRLVVGTLGAGVYWWTAADRVTHLSTADGLSHDFVLSLHADADGHLWVGTDGGGLNRVSPQFFETLPPTRDRVVQTVVEDAAGALWIGYNAGGLERWQEGRLSAWGEAQGLPPAPVRALWPDPDGRLWIGTWGGGLFRFDGERFERFGGALPLWIQALFRDGAGQLWAGSSAGLVRWDGRAWRVFTTREGLGADGVRALAQTADGALWVGTAGGGLSRWQDGRFTTWHQSADGLPGDDIAALYADAEGGLWVATAGRGLARFHQGRWTRFGPRAGLASQSLSYLLDDGAGHLWLGSNAGLMRVPWAALADYAAGRAAFVPCRVFGKADGLPTREATRGSQPAACRARDGRLWFPTIKGLAGVDPGRLPAKPRPPPTVSIEQVWVEGEPLPGEGLRRPPLERVVLRPGQQRLEIEYASVSLVAPDRVRFRYRLEGLEADWTDAGNSRRARFSRLPPGEYRFHVTACNEDGVWNEAGRALVVVVLPPFWRTGWFLALSAAALLGLVGGTVHWVSTRRLRRQLERLRQQEALERERGRIARDLHDQLGAHLTQMALLAELVEGDKDSPAEVEAHSRQLARTARDTARALDEIVWTVNPSNDTLEGLVNYLCKYTQDYAGVAGLRCRLEVPAELPAAPVSPEVRHHVFLAAKEAVTNVVRHARATELWLRVRLGPDRFEVEIEDDGCGPAGMESERARTRSGLTNMRRRLAEVGGQCEIGPAAGRGTRVRLTVPLARASTPPPAAPPSP